MIPQHAELISVLPAKFILHGLTENPAGFDDKTIGEKYYDAPDDSVGKYIDKNYLILSR